MADVAATAGFLLLNLKQLLVHHIHLFKDKKVKLENLDKDLDLLKSFLEEDTVKKQRKSMAMKEMVRQIHTVVYEVEDIIDAFHTKAAIQKSPNCSSIRNRKNLVDLEIISEKVKLIVERVKQFQFGFVPFVDDEELYQHRSPRVRDVVGFADVREDLVCRLTQETDYFDIVSLVGMFGLGKTTLAWKIYSDPQIVRKFPTLIWLCISQEFSAKDIFLSALKQVTSINEDIHAKTDHELADLIAAHLKIGSFLIVIDDVWETNDWDTLRLALPKDNTKGKVLITSRIQGVGSYASQPRPPYNLRLFTVEESWELLQLEVFHKRECPSELEVVGRKIAKSCDGLPLAIVVIGGILARILISSSNILATSKAWEEVSEHVSSYVREEDQLQKSVYLSYDKLPYHLRPLLLYFGLFPKDYEIPVSKLIRMWIAEGFVQQELGYMLEESAEKNLDELINRNLVKSEKFKFDGRVKTCRLHNTLHDFCLTVAASENFLQEIKFNNDGCFTPPISNLHRYRRLSIHSKCLHFISSKPFGHRASSFVCFPEDEFVVSPENSSNIIGGFKLLRVLDVSPFVFTKIDGDMSDLIHLRYIALSSALSVLPSKFNQLPNIQTLMVNTTCRTLEVKVDIWKMIRLRHFKTNAPATLPKSTRSGKKCEELQTLGLISAESYTEELSNRAPNLKKLGIRGRLGLLFDKSNGSFSLQNMRELRKLKLINDTYPKPQREGGLSCLPQHYRFPSGLTSLTLCATFLSWEHMSTLGLLEKLEVLKLKDNAFSGGIWEAVDGGFRCLEVLHIEDTNLIVWNASSHHYPKLRSLVLKYCEKLRGIPTELGHIPSLQKLELYSCMSAAKSAKDILDAKKKKQVEGSAFMLSINPPIE